MSEAENPPAFPLPSVAIGDHGVAHANPGMSLRDYFAGQALVGLLASGQWHNGGHGFGPYIAERAAEIADAMLAERLSRSNNGEGS